MAEYGKMIAVCFIAATLFLGGYWGPFVDRLPILGPLYLIAKVLVLLFLMIWLRATLPRLRYDRLMAFGWKVLLPLGLLNVLVTGGLIVWLG
jgi:NADH-quinone oxidoreductase subunit H